MTSARIQPFCRKCIINIGCYDGTTINPRNVTQRNIPLFIYNNQFCLIWKTTVFSFNRAIEESKINFKYVDIVISDKHPKSYIKYENNPKKVQSQLTNMIFYDFKTFNLDRVIPFANYIY